MGRQGRGAADGSDINGVAPAGLAQPSILCRHTVVLLYLSQVARGDSKIPLHIPPAIFRLHGSSGSLAGRVLPEEEASSAQKPKGTCAKDGLRCLQCVPGLAGTTDPSMLLPASSSPSSSALPGRDAAGGVGAGIRRACPGGAGDTAPAASLQVKPWEKCRSTPCCAAPTGKGQGRPAVPPGG